MHEINRNLLTNIAASPEDVRDIFYTPSKTLLPSSVDLTPFSTQIEDQSSIGSCTANATTSAAELIAKRGGINENLSRLFAYYTSRLDENRLGQDGLQTLRSAMHAGYKVGMCLEDEWPYVVANVDMPPADKCFISAATRKITQYERIELQWWSKPVETIKAALDEGMPVIIALTVNSQIYSVHGKLAEQKYEVLDAQGKRLPSEGGHAVAIVGYDDAIGGFVFANSWGTAWGSNGFGRLEYRHIGELFEAWVVRGFNGVHVEKPIIPAPIPEPAPTEPIDPQPLPEPAQEKSSGNTFAILIAGLAVIAFILKINGMW